MFTNSNFKDQIKAILNLTNDEPLLPETFDSSAESTNN